MTHDQEAWGPYEVRDFVPERFLVENPKDPIAAFGFGRR